MIVNGSGTYAGGSVVGIQAAQLGAGGLAGTTGVWVTGSGNTTATTGAGINAVITSAANVTNILVDRTGTVVAGAGGIMAATAGTGSVTVNAVGNVTAGAGVRH